MFDKTHIRETLLAMERADIAAAQHMPMIRHRQLLR
jgi:hypothetical protein